MAAFVFPVNPSEGDVLVITEGIKYRFVEGAWQLFVFNTPETTFNNIKLTDNLTEGVVNLFHTEQRVRNVTLAGLSKVSSDEITEDDTVIDSLGKLQKQNLNQQADLDGLAENAILTFRINQANGVAGLDANGLVPAVLLPSSMDEIVEYNGIANFPAVGESSKIYIDISDVDHPVQYRWGGSSYHSFQASAGTTDSVTEGAVNKYFTPARAQAAVTSVSGNAGTATKLATPRTITITGVVSGSALFDGSENITINLTGSIPYDIGGSIFGQPAASEVLLSSPACRQYVLTEDQPNAQARAGIAPTANAVFVIAKNGSQIGTITFLAGSQSGVFAFESSVVVYVGDLVTVTAPATADITLTNVDVTLVGNV